MEPRVSETVQAPPLLNVVQLHVEETASLRRQRTRLVAAPHIRLHLLARHDERIAAHLDGIAVAGTAGRELARHAAAEPGCGETFACAAAALVDEDHQAIWALLEPAQPSTPAWRGLVSAFGWVSAHYLRGVTKELLASKHPQARALGLAACAMHEVDPGKPLGDALADPAQPVWSRALDVAAQLGAVAWRDSCLERIGEAADDRRLRAARAALLLGERDRSVAVLRELAALPGPTGDDALMLMLCVLAPSESHELLQQSAGRPEAVRRLVRGAGISGRVHYVPWLVTQCADRGLARLAAESLAMITGLDLDADALNAPRPDGDLDAANPESPSIDEDEDLLWPDAEKVGAWWAAHATRFDPGARWFVGGPLSSAQCAKVLREGQQRQRRAAALLRALSAPDVPVFNTSAPSWRQRRRLASL